MARKHRLLKAVVLAAAAGAALLWLRSREQEHEHTKGPEADMDAAEAPKTAPACDDTEVPVQTPDAPQPAPAQPAETPAPDQPVPEQEQPTARPTVTYRPVRPQDGGPNANPVESHAEKPPVVDGKVDPTKIALPEDFADWDDLGCQG